MRQVGCGRGVALARGRLDASSIDSSFAASEDKSAVCRGRTGVTRFDAHAGSTQCRPGSNTTTRHAIVWIAWGLDKQRIAPANVGSARASLKSYGTDPVRAHARWTGQRSYHDASLQP